MEQLTFNETLTINQFKTKENVSKIDIRKNPSTGKLFFTYGSKVGAVSNKGIPQHPMISEVATADGECFYLLHEEGNGAPVLASF